jgi:hypothetical protein
MRRTLLVAVFTLATIPSGMAADGYREELTTERKIFPTNWISGFVDFAVAPPHNELDLNRCGSWAGVFGGTKASCAAFARYVGSGFVELRPVAKGPAHRLFVFLEPHAYMGSNIPQFQYTDSMSPIALERTAGIGFGMTRNLELRVTTHRVDWLGKYENHLGPADIGKNGPLGSYTTISARWYFGGYGRRMAGY